MAQECARLENLLKHAGSKWGQKEEAPHRDIWSDDEGGHNRMQQQPLRGISSAAKAVNGSNGAANYAKLKTSTLSGWLSKQNTL